MSYRPLSLILSTALSAAVLFAQTPPARPKARKQVLAIGDVSTAFQHDSVSHALATIERLGRESGLYDTYIRTDMQLVTKQPVVGSVTHYVGRAINAKNLDYFDAVFFFSLGEPAIGDQQKADLLSFIKQDGKGFVGAHSADDVFFTWPEYGEMIGGYFDGHPWGVFNAPVIVEDPNFPAMKGLPPALTLRDEIIQHRDFSRGKVRVLARLDASKLDLTNKKVHRTDGDFPIAWAKMYGKGRVFYSTLGHTEESWDDPQVQKMYFEAIKWALGLTDADVTPRPRNN